MSFRIIKDSRLSSIDTTISNKLPRYSGTDNAVAETGSIIYNTATETICFYTGTAWKCVDEGTGDFGCITESSANHGVVIEKPLFLNRFGIAKLQLGGTILIDDEIRELTANDFTVSFESSSMVGTGGPKYLLEDGAIFKAPPANAFPNTCLNYSTMYVRFDFNIAYFGGGPLESFVKYLINNDPVNGVAFLVSNNNNSNTQTYSDIIPLEPGDEVKIGIFNQQADFNIDPKSYILVEILGFE